MTYVVNAAVVLVVEGVVAVAITVDVVVGDVGRPSSMLPNPRKRSAAARGNRTSIRCVRSGGVNTELRQSVNRPL